MIFAKIIILNFVGHFFLQRVFGNGGVRSVAIAKQDIGRAQLLFDLLDAVFFTLNLLSGFERLRLERFRRDGGVTVLDGVITAEDERMRSQVLGFGPLLGPVFVFTNSRFNFGRTFEKRNSTELA